jgi:hypothetical protein
MIASLWLLVPSLLQNATQTPTSLPQCRSVSLSVESVRPAEYEFRFTIRNDSPKAVVLFKFLFARLGSITEDGTWLAALCQWRGCARHVRPN